MALLLTEPARKRQQPVKTTRKRPPLGKVHETNPGDTETTSDPRNNANSIIDLTCKNDESTARLDPDSKMVTTDIEQQTMPNDRINNRDNETLTSNPTESPTREESDNNTEQSSEHSNDEGDNEEEKSTHNSENDENASHDSSDRKLTVKEKSTLDQHGKL